MWPKLGCIYFALFPPPPPLHTSVWSLSMLHIPTASECGARFKRILQQWPFPPRAASQLTDCVSHPANNSARFGQQPRRRKTLNGAFCRIPPRPTSTMRSHHVIPSLNLFRRGRGLIQRGIPVIISERIWSRLDPSHFNRGTELFFFLKRNEQTNKKTYLSEFCAHEDEENESQELARRLHLLPPVCADQRSHMQIQSPLRPPAQQSPPLGSRCLDLLAVITITRTTGFLSSPSAEEMRVSWNLLCAYWSWLLAASPLSAPRRRLFIAASDRAGHQAQDPQTAVPSKARV